METPSCGLMRTVRVEIAVRPAASVTIHSRALFTIQQTRGRRGGQLDSTATKRSPFTRPSRPALPRRSRECRNTVRKKVTV